MVAENLVLVAVFFLVLILLSRLFTKIMRLEPGEVNSYRLMMIFPNLGFMGIPLVRSLYGEEAVIFVAFYIVGYNLLVYSYGILLAMGTRDDIGNAGKGAAKRAGLPWKKMGIMVAQSDLKSLQWDVESVIYRMDFSGQALSASNRKI